MDEADIEKLARFCGRACADSYTRNVYTEESKLSKTIDDLVGRLCIRFPEMEIARIDDTKLMIAYKKCMCNLFLDGFIRDGSFCRCSRENLLANWEAVIGQGNVSVAIESTIQSGSDRCEFLVTLDPLASLSEPD
jgi:hypothetical protein